MAQPDAVTTKHSTAEPEAIPAAPAGSSRSNLSLRVLRGVGELRARAAALDQLAARAMEPNVFYEPWALLPAVSTVGADSELRFVVVSRPGEPSLLTGFFPVALRKRYLHLPERALTMWLHKHSALSTPLKKTSRTGARRQRD